MLFATIFHMIMVIAYVVAPEDYVPSTQGIKTAFYSLMQIGFGVFFLFGVLFIDSAIFWLVGQWGYGDWMHQLPSVILVLFVGTQYVLGAMLINPTKFDIIFAAITVPLALFVTHIVPGYLIESVEDSLYLILGLLIALVILYSIIKGRMLIPRNASPAFKWDITRGYKKIFNRKVNVAMYIVLSAETLLKLLGSSLFIDWVVLVGILFTFLIIFICDRFYNHMKTLQARSQD